MRNWFWLRSYHPFSLFTMLQPTFSSTKIVLRQPSSAFTTLYYWLLILNVKPWCWCKRLLKEPTLICFQGRALHTSSVRSHDCLLTAVHFLAAIRSLLHFQLPSLPPRSPTQEWHLHSSKDSRGNSCSSGIKLKINLLKKYSTISSTLPESDVHLPCLPPLLALEMILFNPPHLL